MQPEKIEKFNSIIREYNQFRHSCLWDDIQAVLQCSQAEAAKLALSHCNMVATWACLTAAGKTDMSYSEMFEKALTTKINDREGYTAFGCSKGGNMNVHPENFYAGVYGIDFKPVYHNSFDLIVNPSSLDPDKFYELKITKTDHYMGCYIENKIFKLSCTGARGIGIPATKGARVDKAHFGWILELF